MSNRPKYSDFDDDPTTVGPGLGQHPANTDPFVPQTGGYGGHQVNDPSSEATMVLDTGGPDMSSEATMVHDSLANPLTPLAKLLVLGGVQEGKEYPLLGTEVSFGREKDNTISHPDLSVSRRHFKVHAKGDKFSLEDLGSSSGTLVNNKKVSGTIKLKHGDKIQVGKTLLQFLMLNEDAVAGEKNPTLMVAGVIVVLGILGIVFGVWWVKSTDTPTPDAGPTRPPVADNNNPTKYLTRGLELKNELKWRQAKLMFQQAKQLAPQSFMANQLLKETDAEEKVDFLLRKADARRLQGLTTEAYETLKKAATLLAPGSVYADKVWTLSIKLTPASAAPAPRRRRRRRRYRRRRRKAKAPARDGRWYYTRGDWRTASTKFSGDKATLVKEFFSLFDKARNTYRRWKPSEALKLLQKAYQKDMQIAGSQGVYTDQLRKMLANAFCAKGVELLKQKKYKKGYKLFSKVGVYQPKHEGVNTEYEKLRTLAGTWLTKAKAIMAKDRNKGRAMLKQILSVTSRTDDVNSKARALLLK